jgi:hypothetical protein
MSVVSLLFSVQIKKDDAIGFCSGNALPISGSLPRKGKTIADLWSSLRHFQYGATALFLLITLVMKGKLLYLYCFQERNHSNVLEKESKELQKRKNRVYTLFTIMVFGVSYVAWAAIGCTRLSTIQHFYQLGPATNRFFSEHHCASEVRLVSYAKAAIIQLFVTGFLSLGTAFCCRIEECFLPTTPIFVPQATTANSNFPIEAQQMTRLHSTSTEVAV